MKKKVILVDFDDTLETKKSNGEIIYNEPLIKALIQAKKEGAIIIGFTNWYSINYRYGLPGRKMLIEYLENEGMKLTAMNTTWNFLNIFELINKEKKQSETHQNYLVDLPRSSRHYPTTTVATRALWQYYKLEELALDRLMGNDMV